MNLNFSLRQGLLGVVTAVGLLIGGCKNDPVPTPNPNSITRVAATTANLTALTAALNKTGLNTTLSTAGAFTAFAPTDAAFAALPAPLNNAANINGIAATDQATIDRLRGILLYHVLGARFFVADIASGSSTQVSQRTATGSTNDNVLTFTKTTNGALFVNGVQLATADIPANNGTVHTIGQVLLPPTRTIADLIIANSTGTAGTSASGYSTLVNILTTRPAAAPILAAAQSSGNITVFAPNNGAFTALRAQLNLRDFTAASVPDDLLLRILRLHVIGTGRVLSSEVPTGPVTTLGGAVTATNTFPTVTLRGPGNPTPATPTPTPAAPTLPTVVLSPLASNQLATNGVLHTIDRVILP